HRCGFEETAARVDHEDVRQSRRGLIEVRIRRRGDVDRARQRPQKRQLRLDAWAGRGARTRARRWGRSAAACRLGGASAALLPALGTGGASGTPGGPAGPPDARAYEQVSSQHKNGNEAGINLRVGSPIAAYASALPGGDRVAYFQLGPSGQTSSGTDLY